MARPARKHSSGLNSFQRAIQLCEAGTRLQAYSVKNQKQLLSLSLRGAAPQATKQSRVFIQTIVCRLGEIASG